MHPRPTLVRRGWTSLDGEWLVDGRPCVVPSGVPTSSTGGSASYSTTFTAASRAGERVILHCEGADHTARVRVDGRFVGEHDGAYTRFSFDITDALAPGDTHDLTIDTTDPPFDPTIPRGKQAWTPEPDTIWYRRMSGLWRSVWLEVVPATHIADVHWVTPDTTGRLTGEITVATSPASVSTRSLVPGELLDPRGELHDHRITATFRLGAAHLADVTLPAAERVTLDVNLATTIPADQLLWHPDHPRLIDIDLTLASGDSVVDRVASYTGLRVVSTGSTDVARVVSTSSTDVARVVSTSSTDVARVVSTSSTDVPTDSTGAILLNGTPLFQRLVLEQAYWPDTLYTAPSLDALRREAELIKELGFNGLRLHQTTADPRFLRLCDELGLLVWADVPATHAFTPDTPGRTASLLEELIARDRNHPSVVAWVAYNESWGLPALGRDPAHAAAVTRLYELAKRLDPTRLTLGNDGWQHVVGDVVGVHDYDHSPARLRRRYHPRLVAATLALGRPGQRWLVLPASGRRGPLSALGRLAHVWHLRRNRTPLVLTEFGGVSLDTRPDAWEGYGRVHTPEALVQQVAALVAAAEASGFAGFCWTQLTDTDQEQNGLAHPDRTPKAPAAALAAAIRGRG